MTSDGGSSGGTDMQFVTIPVTPKTAGLNPNANVFHCKVPPTPPDSTPEWIPGDELDDHNNTSLLTLQTSENHVPYVNGDGGPLTPPKTSPVAVTFPPTPESPALPPPVTDIAIQFTNGGLPSPPHTASPTSNTSAATTSDHSDGGNVSIPENGVPQDQLKNLLKTQLEYYFSRENLANDSYLVSQMDGDQYVPITTIANFNQIKKLTNSVELVIEALRDSPNVQVDEKGEKVRPLHKRCVVILREVAESTPVTDIETLFSGVNCPPFLSCEFAHNNSWYVTFPTDEDAQRAYQYLREDVRNFQGRPIMARIKAKPLVRTSFPPKNGFKQNQAGYDASAQDGSQMQMQPKMGGFPSNQSYAPFAPVPTTPQYIISQPVSQQNYPFFPPNTVVQPWPQANPMPFFDPGSVSNALPLSAFAANGYTAAATFKMPANNSAPQNSSNANTGRHTYNARNRNQKPHRSNSSQDYERTGNQNDGRINNRLEHRMDRAMGDRSMNDAAMNERLSDRISNSRMDRGIDSRNMDSRMQGSQDRHMGRSRNNADGSHMPRARQENSYHMNSHGPMHMSGSHGTQAHTAHTGPPPPAASSQSSVSAGALASMSTQQDSHPHHSTPPPQPTLARPLDQQAGKEINSQPLLKKTNYRSRRRKEEEIKPVRSTNSLAQPPPATMSRDCPVKPTAANSPKFDLEATAFPPLPGGPSQPPVTASLSSGDVFENKMSDVVKGTAKAMTREICKPSNSPPLPQPVASVAMSAAPISTSKSNSATAQKSADGKGAATPGVSASGASTTCTSSSTTATSSQSNAQHSPPLSPSKVTKSNNAEKSSTTASANASSNSQLPANAKQPPPAEDNGVPKLSYAAMLQRSKEIREAAAAAADAENKETSDSPVSKDSSSSNPSTAGAAPVPRPPALREQAQSASARSGVAPRGEAGQPRKDRDSKEEPRFSDTRGPRQLKENRERRDMRDTRDTRDTRDPRDRFSRDRPSFPPRDRRRDFREPETREPRFNASK